MTRKFSVIIERDAEGLVIVPLDHDALLHRLVCSELRIREKHLDRGSGREVGRPVHHEGISPLE